MKTLLRDMIAATGVTWLICLIWMTGCQTSHPYGQPDRVAALIDRDPILEEELNNRLPLGAFKDKKALYSLQKKELTQLIIGKLLEKEAQRQKAEVSTLLAKNVYKKIKPVKDKEIKDFFEKNKGEFGNISFQEAQNIIRDSLYRQRKKEAFSAYYNDLLKNGNVQIFLRQPS